MRLIEHSSFSVPLAAHRSRCCFVHIMGTWPKLWQQGGQVMLGYLSQSKHSYSRWLVQMGALYSRVSNRKNEGDMDHKCHTGALFCIGAWPSLLLLLSWLAHLQMDRQRFFSLCRNVSGPSVTLWLAHHNNSHWSPSGRAGHIFLGNHSKTRNERTAMLLLTHSRLSHSSAHSGVPASRWKAAEGLKASFTAAGFKLSLKSSHGAMGSSRGCGEPVSKPAA